MAAQQGTWSLRDEFGKWLVLGAEREAVLVGVALCFSFNRALRAMLPAQRVKVFHTTIMQVILHSIHLLFPSTINFFSISTCFSCAFTLCL